MEKKNWFKLLNLKALVVSVLLILPLLSACTNQSAPDEDVEVNEVTSQDSENDAESFLNGKRLNKYSGDGPDQLTFSNDELLVSTTSNIPPFLPSVENDEYLQEADAYVYEDINLVDGDNNEFIVYYDEEELFNFQLNDNNMLENKDGTVYSVDG